MRDLEIAALFAFSSILVGLGVVFLGWFVVNWLDKMHQDNEERLKELEEATLTKEQRQESWMPRD